MKRLMRSASLGYCWFRYGYRRDITYRRYYRRSGERLARILTNAEWEIYQSHKQPIRF